MMTKTIGYYIFAFVYYASRLFPVNKLKYSCIMTHDDGEDSNVSIVVRELKDKRRNIPSAILPNQKQSR